VRSDASKAVRICAALSEGTTHPLDEQPQRRKEVSQIYKALGFAPLGVSQGLSTILFIHGPCRRSCTRSGNRNRAKSSGISISIRTEEVIWWLH